MDEKEIQKMIIEERAFRMKSVGQALIIATAFVGIKLVELLIKFVDVAAKHW